jgi:alanine dehydrogenase
MSHDSEKQETPASPRGAAIELLQRNPAFRAGAGRRLETDSGSPPHLRNGLNVCAGKLTCREVAQALNYDYFDPPEAIGRAA